MFHGWRLDDIVVLLIYFDVPYPDCVPGLCPLLYIVCPRLIVRVAAAVSLTQGRSWGRGALFLLRLTSWFLPVCLGRGTSCCLATLSLINTRPTVCSFLWPGSLFCPGPCCLLWSEEPDSDHATWPQVFVLLALGFHFVSSVYRAPDSQQCQASAELSKPVPVWQSSIDLDWKK